MHIYFFLSTNLHIIKIYQELKAQSIKNSIIITERDALVRMMEDKSSSQNIRNSFLQEKLAFFLVGCEKLCFNHSDTKDTELLKELKELTRTLDMRDNNCFAKERSFDETF
jgi:hypothetical protein